VRALADDNSRKAQDASRDYILDVDAPPGAPPLLTVYGGKITTYRRLAEAALAKLSASLGGKPWTAGSTLPGGDFPWDGRGAVMARVGARYSFLTEAQARRLVNTYGTRVDRVLGDAKTRADLGEDFGADLTAAEVRYLMRHEWAETAEDVLWRRTKLGLFFDPLAQDALAQFMASESSRPAAAE
jgi:glycerol-3-phosphate dehydrogenase